MQRVWGKRLDTKRSRPCQGTLSLPSAYARYIVWSLLTIVKAVRRIIIRITKVVTRGRTGAAAIAEVSAEEAEGRIEWMRMFTQSN